MAGNSFFDPSPFEQVEVDETMEAERLRRRRELEQNPDELYDPDNFADGYFERSYPPIGRNVLQTLDHADGPTEMLRALGYDGRIGGAAGHNGGRDVAMFNRGTVFSRTTGEQLFANGAERLGSANAFFHGTGGEPFERADPSRFDREGIFGPGFNATSSRDEAASYARDRSGTDNGWSVMGPLSFDINSPVPREMPIGDMQSIVRDVITEFGADRRPVLASAAQQFRGLMDVAKRTGNVDDAALVLMHLGQMTSPELVQGALRRLGYTGINYRGGLYGGPGNEISVAWEPGQVRHANGDLLYSAPGLPVPTADERSR